MMSDDVKKKILILSSFPAPYRIDVFKGLAKLFDVDMFFGTNKDQNRSKDYFILKGAFRYYVINNLEDEAYFKKCVKKLDTYDLVLAYDWYLPFAMRVEHKCITTHIPYIVNCDGAFIREPSNFIGVIKDKIKQYFISNASKCFASGKYAQKYFEHYGAQPENIAIHNFTSLHEEDILAQPVSQREKKELRLELGLTNRKTVLSIGQFIYRKGFDTLLEAWGDLDKCYQLVIIGGGEEKENYEGIIRNHNYENVKLIDFKPKEEISKFYKASDLFVLSTREDIWGLVINEAMACGLPVISTDRCIAALELVTDTAGIITLVEDKEALYNAIRQILIDPKLHEIGANNIQLMRQCTIRKIIEKHIDTINALLD